MFPKNLSVGVGVLLDFDADFVCVALQTTSEKKIEKKELVEKGGVHFSCGDGYQKTEEHKKTKKNLERTPKKHFCNSKAAKFKKKSSPKIA